nr:hypothetical protein CFP56_46297 [Quercus suber]
MGATVIHCLDVLLEDTDIGKALTEYVSYAAIENLVLGASHHGFMRFKSSSVPSTVSKGAPDFCSIYVISKGKPHSPSNEPVRPPSTKGGRGLNAKAYSDLSESDTEISFIRSDRPSIERLSPTVYDLTDSGRTSRLSTSSDQSFQSNHLDDKFSDLSFLHDISSFSQESGRTSCSWSSQNLLHICQNYLEEGLQKYSQTHKIQGKIPMIFTAV